jgi:hypothetical protein
VTVEVIIQISKLFATPFSIILLFLYYSPTKSKVIDSKPKLDIKSNRQQGGTCWKDEDRKEPPRV